MMQRPYTTIAAQRNDHAAPVLAPSRALKSNLRPPWRKGQSGNPSGYRGAYGEVVKIAREYSEHAIRRLGELLESEDERVAAVAAQALLDRAWGKPREIPDDAAKSELDLSRLSRDERDALWALLEKAGVLQDGSESTKVRKT
jgi:hypothetical protein